MSEYVDLNDQSGNKANNDTLHNGALATSADTSGPLSINFGEELCGRLESFCRQNDSTLFNTLLSAFQVLMYRYNITGSIDILTDTDDKCAFYTFALDTEVTGDMHYGALLKHVKATVAAAQQATVGTDDNRSNASAARILFATDERTNANTSRITRSGKQQLVFVFAAPGNISVLFDPAIYPAATVAGMLAHYKQLLNSIVTSPNGLIGELSMMTEEDRHQLFDVFNGTKLPYAADKTIVDLFEEQVEKTPQNIALFMGDSTMTYRELNNRANQLARHLVAIGAQQEDNIALVVDRHFDMIIGMFAILKAGGAYVPVTPDAPHDRQQYLLTQSSVKFVLSNLDNDLAASVPGVKAIDMRSVVYNKYEDSNLGLAISSRQLAYTIYTSGSTGVPKGVMIEHHSVINLVAWVNKTFSVNESDRLLFVTSMGFDLSVYDIFGMLAVGGALVIVQKSEVPDVVRMADILDRYKVTFWDSVPSTMDYLATRIAANDANYRQTSLRLVFLSGDWIPVNLPDKIRNVFPNASVISLGGATEGTVWSNFYPVEQVRSDWRSIPYGKPIDNNSFYILNEQFQPVPDGVVGELFIGGVGVARGYANDPVKTANAFFPDPFTDQWGGRMYRTGDLGRMLPDGNMEFIGRKDSQVKIRGHRVELGEIENVIRQNPSVGKAIVLLSEDKNQLLAFIVPGKYYDRDTVIALCKKKLPDYMVPGKWLEIDSLPLTANGKTDTKALVRMGSGKSTERSYVAPVTELEKQLAAAWIEVLQLEKVGVTDNFFDLGGQSLIAVELIHKMEKNAGKELPLNILYKCPTIADLATYIQQEPERKKWRSLVAMKPTGNKTPVYIVHGDGLSLSNFQNLANYVDPEQPVFSLQPVGLNGVDEPLENIVEIASHYIAEIIEHNPDGPYMLGGYSFGGYVAIEMRKQLEAMGKTVKMTAIFDTNAENVNYAKGWAAALPKKIKRQVPKFLFIAQSIVTRPVTTIKYQYQLFSKRFDNLCYKVGIKQRPELKGIDLHINKINETHFRAFKKYQLSPFDDKVYLFKAQSRLYFVDDFKFLGWKNYARKGVEVYNVPGDHRTMFHPPYVSELARSLQHALDNC